MCSVCVGLGASGIYGTVQSGSGSAKGCGVTGSPRMQLRAAVVYEYTRGRYCGIVASPETRGVELHSEMDICVYRSMSG